MIRVLGGPKRLCDGMTRRDLLRVGSLGMLGLGLPNVGLSAERRAQPAMLNGFGRAKSCIFLFMYGSPSQLETFDPKPDAPAEIRGEFGCIPSSVPGLNVCEGLPRLAQVMDKVTVIRSMSHPYPIHGVAYATTGIPRIDVAQELAPRDVNHWPFIGSVVDAVDRRDAGAGGRRSPVPANLVLPFAFSSQRAGEVPRAGPYGGFLGRAYDPVCTEFVGKGTKVAKKTLAGQTWEDVEPYRGITPESRFQLGAVRELEAELTLDRLDRRKSLLQQIEDQRRAIDARTNSAVGRHRAMAYDLLGSERLRRAFDLGEEADETRSLYGMTLFGQGALTARRLVEAGGRFVNRFLGRVRPGRHRLGYALGPFSEDEAGIASRSRRHAFRPVARPRPAWVDGRNAGRALERARPNAPAHHG